MKTQILRNIDQAFLQFEFAIKLMVYFELNKVDKDEFDRDLTILEEKDNIVFPDNSFHTYNDLILASQNNVIVCFGVSAITLDRSLADAGIDRKPDDLSENGSLRTLIYMIRCAFAHNMIEPKWDVHIKYKKSIKLNLNNENLIIDLSQMHGKGFDYKDIGGVKNWFIIKNLAKKLIIES